VFSRKPKSKGLAGIGSVQARSNMLKIARFMSGKRAELNEFGLKNNQN
jgi:hypothetical protein